MGRSQRDPVSLSPDASIFPLLSLTNRSICLSCRDRKINVPNDLKIFSSAKEKTSHERSTQRLHYKYKYRPSYITLLISSLLCNLGYEYAATFVMGIIGGFYEAILNLSYSQFLSIMWRALSIITIVSILKTLLSILTEQVALIFRKVLVESCHTLYFRNKNSYDLILSGEVNFSEFPEKKVNPLNVNCHLERRIANKSSEVEIEETTSSEDTLPYNETLKVRGENNEYQEDKDLIQPLLRKDSLTSSTIEKRNTQGKSLDNPDQRITNDIDQFSSTLPALLLQIILAPSIIGYYTYKLYTFFGWPAPAFCWAYFLLGALINNFLIKLIIPIVYVGEKLEDTFRYMHSLFRSKIESITLSKGITFCGKKISSQFDNLLKNRQGIIYAHLPLYLFTNFYNYFGSIVNYAAVGYAVLYINEHRGVNDQMQAPEIGALYGEGSYACIYLISAFSDLFDAFGTIGTLSGIAPRILELQDALELIDRSNYDVDKEKMISRGQLNIPCDNKERDDEDISLRSQKYSFDKDLDSSSLENSQHIPTIYSEQIENETIQSIGMCSKDIVMLNVQNLTVAIPSYPSISFFGTQQCKKQEIANTSNTEIEYTTANSTFIPSSCSEVSINCSSPISCKDSVSVPVLSISPRKNLSISANLSSISFKDEDCNKILLRDLSFKVYEGKSLLIQGQSGCGKTSLLKTLAGLWPPLQGSIYFTLPSAICDINNRNVSCHEEKSCNTTNFPSRLTTEVMFVPQQPYCFEGTLVDLILYPKTYQAIKIIVKKEERSDESHFSQFGVNSQQGKKDSQGEIAAKYEVQNSNLSHIRDTERKEGEILRIYLNEIAEVMESAGLSYLFRRYIYNSALFALANERQENDKTREETDDSFRLSSDEVDIYPYLQVYNFDQILSMGEKQRISFARIFFHTPSLVFLDEVTSAVDIAMEEMLYRRVKNMVVPTSSLKKKEHDTNAFVYSSDKFHELEGKWKESETQKATSKEKIDGSNDEIIAPRVTIISVGHRDSLVSLHDEVITL